MGNPSDWIPEVKKAIFWFFQKFFRKIMVFQAKNEKKNFINTFWSKMSQNLFHTYFPIIFMIWAHQNGICGIFDSFWQFFVVFTIPPSESNLGGSYKPEWAFQPKFWFYTFNSMSGYHKLTGGYKTKPFENWQT